MRLFDDEDGPSPFFVDTEEKIAEPVHKFFDAPGALGVRNPELVANRCKKFQGRHFGVEDKGDLAVFGHLFQEAAAYHRLACSDFTGEKHEAPVDPYAIHEMGQGLAVPLADIEIVGIR